LQPFCCDRSGCRTGAKLAMPFYVGIVACSPSGDAVRCELISAEFAVNRGDQLFTSPIGGPASLATSLRDRSLLPVWISHSSSRAPFTISLSMVFFAISEAPTRRSLHILNPCSCHRQMENLCSRRCDAAWLCCTELPIILAHADPPLSRSI
jgi:hypothetical protein